MVKVIYRSIFCILIIIAAGLSAGCSSSSEDTPPANNESPINEQPGDQTPAPTPEPTPEPGPTPVLGEDSDGDGVVDANDAFPTDPVRVAPLPVEFDMGVTYSRQTYVSPTGNDDTGDGSIGLPYRTVVRAARNATPGTRINLQAGTYPVQGSIGNLQGTANEPIAIVGSGNVVFDAAGANQVLHFSDPRYVVLEGFTIQNAAQNGINIDDGGSYATPAEYVIIRNVRFHNIGTGGNHDCLKLSGVDRFLVLNGEFEDCDHGEAIDMVGCHAGVIKGNFFHNMPINAINTKGGSSDILIQGNRFSDIASRAINAGGSTGLDYFRPIDAPYEGARIRILANIFERVGNNSGASVAFTGCDRCVFANNTIIEPRTYIVRILQESRDARFVPSRNGYFVNNIIMFSESDIRSYVNIGDLTAPATFTFGNNLWYALDNAAFSGPGISSPIPPETGSIIQQHPLLDLANANYAIPANSPAAGQGRAVPGSIESDYAGVLFATPLDIGAFKAQ
ncbi:MAG TPA: right-handed parallel beta-helix repeat-containing protein [Gammaproteobacteria bacterium]